MKRRNIPPAGLLFLFVVGFLFLSCSKGSGYGSGNGSNSNSSTISISYSAYSNTNLQVKQGTSVTWTNNDNMVHTATADDNSFDSGDIGTGKSWSKTFNTLGSFPYHCSHHGTMKGTIVVVY